MRTIACSMPLSISSVKPSASSVNSSFSLMIPLLLTPFTLTEHLLISSASSAVIWGTNCSSITWNLFISTVFFVFYCLFSKAILLIMIFTIKSSIFFVLLQYYCYLFCIRFFWEKIRNFAVKFFIVIIYMNYLY